MIIDESKLPEQFRRGLDAIRSREVEQARVVAIDGNFAFVTLGIERLSEIYCEQEAELFVRLPLNFPNAHPYGLVTRPFLSRRDGAKIERQHLDHPNAKPVADALGITGLGFWSWNWDRMPARRPEDLALAVEWARKRIRAG